MDLFINSLNSIALKILVLVGFSAVTSLLIHFIFFRVLKVLQTNGNKMKKHSIKRFKGPSFLFLLVVSFALFNMFLETKVQAHRIIDHVLVVSVIISLTWFAINGVKIVKYFILLKYDVTTEDNLEARKVATQLRVFERIIITVVLIIAIASILMTFDSIKKVGINLLASAGIAGVILGLAAQKSIGNIIAGVQIALTQPIRIDDVLIIENEWGKVEEINLTYVVMKIWDERRLVIPLSYFIDKPFQNWTRSTAQLLGTVFLYVDYTVKVDAIREELPKILNSTNLWDKRVGIVQVTDATERTMEVRILVSAKDSPTAFDLRVLVREKLIQFLQENYPESLPKVRFEMEKKE